GHWNDAYAFVTLHQPSAFYGVNSMPLGSGLKDTHGLNAGLYELASGPEVCGYFDAVMRQRLLASGRVDYHPMTDYRGEGRLLSLLSGEETRVEVRRKTVDATWFGTSVPSTHTPAFTLAEGVRLVPPNALPHLAQSGAPVPDRYVILGAGKTAMDAGLWLISAGVPADRITWVRPRESWLLNRLCTQPGEEFFHDSIGGQARAFEAFATAPSADALFEQLEAAGNMLRIDPSVRPQMFHYATVSAGEVEVLRRITDVIRQGRVRAIEAGGLRFDAGFVPVAAGALYIDCTASAVTRRPAVPVFDGDRITLQMIRMPAPTFSAALAAWVEVHIGDQARRNELCTPCPLPDAVGDYPETELANLRNQLIWSSEPELRRWIRDSRLDGFGKVARAVTPDQTDRMAVLTALRDRAWPAAANLQRLAGLSVDATPA
ncbi:MAG: NAD(P)/FAD-dependent oxidoreductase, partial [bacterium]